LQVAILRFTGNQPYAEPFAVRMAAVVVTVPLLVGVLIVQRRIITGQQAGAVKGYVPVPNSIVNAVSGETRRCCVVWSSDHLRLRER
jgi:hypothetical protein